MGCRRLRKRNAPSVLPSSLSFSPSLVSSLPALSSRSRSSNSVRSIEKLIAWSYPLASSGADNSYSTGVLRGLEANNAVIIDIADDTGAATAGSLPTPPAEAPFALPPLRSREVASDCTPLRALMAEPGESAAPAAAQASDVPPTLTSASATPPSPSTSTRPRQQPSPTPLRLTLETREARQTLRFAEIWDGEAPAIVVTAVASGSTAAEFGVVAGLAPV